MRLLNLTILFSILLSGLVLAGPIAIKDVSTTDTNPGGVTDVHILLDNQGDKDIKDISLSLDLSNSPFAPEGSAAEKTIEEIKENEVAAVSFQLVISPDAKPQIYKIPLTIKYNNTQEATVISIKVISKPDLELAVEESDILKVGDTGKITVRFVNKGLSGIKFLTATLIPSPDYIILSAPSFYIGKIDPDDFETVTFQISLNNKIKFLPIKTVYRDSDNNQYTKTEFLDVSVYSQEEAKKLGLTKTNYTLRIIIIVVILIILFFIIRAIRKSRRAKKLKLG